LLAHASAQRKGRSPRQPGSTLGWESEHRIHFQACDWLNFLWTFEMADDKFPRILTPEFRAVYVWTQKPQPPLQEGQDAKYKVGMLFDKSNAKVVKQLKTIIATADEMLKTRFPKLTSKAFQPWLRNGDTDEGLLSGSNPELFAGMYYAQAKSKDAPGIVDRNRKLIIDPDEFYAGCYAVASCAMFTYDKASKKGAGLLLNNLMKLRDGERLAGKRDPESDFEEFASETGTEDDDALV
jgi:hypothetical protein